MTPDLPAVRSLCAASTNSIKGQVVRSSIGTNFVAIDLDRHACGGKAERLYVPKEQVQAVILDR
jgi:hypothetical protein